VIWLDEEPDQDIVTECLLRTMDTPTMPGGGLLMLTFTPLKGIGGGQAARGIPAKMKRRQSAIVLATHRSNRLTY
jgi:phage terminase large subunit-like protein